MYNPTNLNTMKKFAASWNDLPTWEKRAEIIREVIIEGMGLKNMPAIEGAFHTITVTGKILSPSFRRNN